MNLLKVTENTIKGIGNNILPVGMIKPTGIVFEITDRCNSHCKHCNKWNIQSKGEMNRLDIINVFSDKLFDKIQTIILTGGEMFVRDDIELIISYFNIRFPNAIFYLSTNGLLPDKALSTVKLMIDLKMKFGIGTSLDGTYDNHDCIRGTTGNFQKVDYMLRELIKLRKEYDFELAVGYVLSHHTVDNFDQTQSYVKSLGLELFSQWYDSNEFYGNNKDTVDIEKHLRIVNQMPDSPRRRMWIHYLNTGKINLSCYAMKTFFVLRSNGDIAPCLTHYNAIAGNVLKDSPSNVWESLKAEESRKIVIDCSGCLNSWGVEWSLNSLYIPIIRFELTRRLGF